MCNYRDELMDDPFHYRIMVPDDQDLKHLLRLIMILCLECIEVEMRPIHLCPVISFGKTCKKM